MENSLKEKFMRDDLFEIQVDIEQEMKYAQDESISMRRDIRRNLIVNTALERAERILNHFADGSIEEINYLTVEVARKYNEKVHQALASQLRTKDMTDDTKLPRKAWIGKKKGG